MSTPQDKQSLQARYERLSRLYQVSNLIHSTLDPQETLKLIVQQAVEMVGASSGSIMLINPTTGFLEVLAAHGLPPIADQLKLRVGEGITGWVARTGACVLVGDVTKDPRYLMLRPEVRSELAVPLVTGDEPRGVLNVDSDRLDAFGPEDQEMLESLAVQVVRAIQNTWQYEQFRLKAGLFEALARVSQTINSRLNVDDALNTITREACDLMKARMCSLMLLDPTGQWLELRASYGASESYVNKPKLTVDESLLGGVVRRRKPTQVENVQTSNLYQNVDLARKEGLVSLLSVPLLYSGQCKGTLNVYTGQPYNFSNEEIHILNALAELSALAIEKASLYERVVDVEEQLRQNEKLSALGLLAAEVAHEIRNPLTVMKMLYHSLDLQFGAGDPRADDARIIGEKMDHLNRIVEQILDFARTTEPEMGPVNLNELIEELGLLVRHKLRNQQVTWARELDPALPLVSGDSTQLEQAFLNLVLNAAEAMPTGGQLTIVTRHMQDSAGRWVEVIFRDTGHGMNKVQRDRALSSVLSTTKARGTGLGLAIVSRVAETHQGQLEIRSQPGLGTEVVVRLPVSVR